MATQEVQWLNKTLNMNEQSKIEQLLYATPALKQEKFLPSSIDPISLFTKLCQDIG